MVVAPKPLISAPQIVIYSLASELWTYLSSLELPDQSEVITNFSGRSKIGNEWACYLVGKCNREFLKANSMDTRNEDPVIIIRIKIEGLFGKTDIQISADGKTLKR